MLSLMLTSLRLQAQTDQSEGLNPSSERLLNAHRQKPHFRFKRLQDDQLSLISSHLSAAQDQQGFLWFGGENGLSRFDGYQFKRFHNTQDPSSLSNNFVSTLLVDSQNTLWVGTAAGLNRYHAETEKFTRFTHSHEDHNSLSHNAVASVVEDKSGNMWVATKAGGLNRFTPKDGQFKRFIHSGDEAHKNRIESLALDEYDTLWIGTNHAGLVRFDLKEQRFVPTKMPADVAKYLTKHQIMSIFVSTDHTLWLGTYGGGLIRYNPRNAQAKIFLHSPGNKYSLNSNFIWKVQGDRQGNIWIACDGGGLHLLPSGQGRDERDAVFYQYIPKASDSSSLLSAKTRSIFQDRNGNLWVGHFPSGLSMLDPYASAFRTYRHHPYEEHSLSDNGVISIAEDPDGNLWLGTEKGLNHLDRNTHQITRLKTPPGESSGLSRSPILSLLVDSAQNVWVGTWHGGLYKRPAGSEHFEHYFPEANNLNSLSDPTVWSLYEDSDKHIWAGTAKGLNRYQPKENHFTRYQHRPGEANSLLDSTINTLFEDSQRNFWLGTRHGISLLNRDAGTFDHFSNDKTNPHSLSANYVWAIAEDSTDHALWFTTLGGGVSRLTYYSDYEPPKFERFQVSDGLANDAVTGVLEDDQKNLWFATGQGLSRLNLHRGNIDNFDQNHGIAGNVHNRNAYHKTRDGELAFGSTEGLSIFNPNALAHNRHAPPVYITDMQVFYKPVTIGDASAVLQTAITHTELITLKYTQSIFSFEFKALNYLMPEKNQYAHQLEGFDNRWNYVGTRRTATYTNLDPGFYTFRVKASNNEGIWNEQGVSIDILILPPWWQTWWAYGLYLLGAGLIFSLIFYTLWNKKQTQIAQAQKQARTRFFASMSHEIRTPLTAIKGYAELIESATTNDSALNSHANTIISGSNHLMQIVNDILDLSKIEAGKITIDNIKTHLPNLIQEIETTFAILAAKKKLDFLVRLDSLIPEYVSADPIRVKQILINLCGNAIKFTQTGQIELCIAYMRTEQQILFHVKDSGIGMSKEQSTKLFKAFTQASSSTTREYGGTGLGLYVSQQLATNMGGSITVQSEVNKGSVFTVNINGAPLENTQWLKQLPARPIILPQLSMQQAPLSTDQSITESMFVNQDTQALPQFMPDLTGHVLYAENHQNNQSFVRSTFERTAVNLTLVDNGHEALKAVESTLIETRLAKFKHTPASLSAPFDLILLDLNMPLLDGVSTARELLKKGIHIPLIAVTSNASKANIDEYIELGFVAFIERPFNSEQLFTTVAPFLSPKKVQYPRCEGRVLLAEDNKTNQILVQHIVAQTGVELIIVDNGQQVLDYVRDEAVDLVLMDIQMPVMDGKTATQRLRAQGFKPPIYALTAENDPAMLHTYVQAGCTHCLAKPIDAIQLQRIIFECIGSESSN
ncbi:MAG: hypothetical protein COA42_09940 [Alteromonadaceae bacterium]|nr:MAG: hypothetical protein COA42_09940 [Alteromonadaceae bacterium]